MITSVGHKIKGYIFRSYETKTDLKGDEVGMKASALFVRELERLYLLFLGPNLSLISIVTILFITS